MTPPDARPRAQRAPVDQHRVADANPTGWYDLALVGPGLALTLMHPGSGLAGALLRMIVI